MSLKKIIGQLHLWLGLTSGLLVFVIAITGCIYAFQAEIRDLTEPYRFVQPCESEILPPSTLMKIARRELPGKLVHAVMYESKKKAAKAIFYSDKDKYYYIVYIDPFSGQVLKVSDEEGGFFSFILDGHFYLWLPPTIGQPVVACATLVFFIMILSGLFLWWPRNKNGVKQRFKLKWNARWRRRNYDLHNVIGFYVSWLAIIFAVTGLVWGFEWFSKGYYQLISGGAEFKEYSSPVSKPPAMTSAVTEPLDQLWLSLRKEIPPEGSIELHTHEDSLSCIAVNINPDPDTYWQTDYRYYDQYNLKELSVDHIWGRSEANGVAQKLIRMNYDIHVGAVLGFGGKVLAFLASLIIASLPITGFLIWWGRRYKKM